AAPLRGTGGSACRSPRGSSALSPAACWSGARSDLHGRELRFLLLVEELLVLRRTVQRRGRGLAAGHDLGQLVEVAGADLALVLDRGEPLLGGGELLLLQLDEGAHVVARIAVRQLEHRIVESMEAGERDELELVAHG